MVEHSPQLPQGFTPVDNVTFWPGKTAFWQITGSSVHCNSSAAGAASQVGSTIEHTKCLDAKHLGCAGDQLTATCDFDSMGMSHGVSAGGTHHDEMCNLYFMMWSELPIFYTCFNGDTSADRNGAGKPKHVPCAALLHGLSDSPQATAWHALLLVVAQASHLGRSSDSCRSKA